MDFSKLVEFVTEAKTVRHGNAYKSSVEGTGPKGFSGGSAGFGGVQTPEPVKDKYFDQSKQWQLDTDLSDKGVSKPQKGDSGVKEQSKMWMTMVNVFGLLANDPNFQKEVKELANSFDRKRDSYRLNRETEDGTLEKYDEESRINVLPRTIDKQEGEIIELEDQINKIKNKITIGSYSDDKKNDIRAKLSGQITELGIKIDNLNKKKRGLGKKYGKDEIESKANEIQSEINSSKLEIQNKEEILGDLKITKANINALAREINDRQAQIDKIRPRLEKNKEELAHLVARIEKIQENNERLNAAAVESFKELINSSARKLSIKLKHEHDQVGTVKDLSSIQWDVMKPQLANKIAMFDALATQDPTINPVFGYFDLIETRYNEGMAEGGNYVKDLDPREFNPEVNITKIRDYNMLPIVSMLRIYNAARRAHKQPISLSSIDYEGHNAAMEWLRNTLKSVKNNPPKWLDENFKEEVYNQIQKLSIPDQTKHEIVTRLNDGWSVNKRGVTPPISLLSSIESAGKNVEQAQALQAESKNVVFIDEVDKLIKEYNYDDDDFKIDIIEVFGSKK